MLKSELGEFIQQLRIKRGLTQEVLASELGLSRPTYLLVEHGKKELKIPEAERLADILGISLEALLAGRDTAPAVEICEEGGPYAEEKMPLRISVPRKDLDKFKEVLLYILSRVGGKPNVGETVLYKLLYFIDFDYYEKFERQLIGATYIKNHYGPTPVEFKAVVEDMVLKGEVVRVSSKYFEHSQKKYLPVREPDLTKLKDARELRHIDEVLARLSDRTAKELSDYSHEDVPWLIAEENGPLDYEAVFYRTPKTSVRHDDGPD